VVAKVQNNTLIAQMSSQGKWELSICAGPP
jgi:hypothetical protein